MADRQDGRGGENSAQAEVAQDPETETVAGLPPGKTTAGGTADEARSPSPARDRRDAGWPKRLWFWLTDKVLDLASSASAARAPLAVAVTFWLAMLVPDQTDEAVRVLLDPHAPRYWSILLWLVLCGLFGLQMLLGGLYAFGAIEGHPMHERPRKAIDRFLFSLIMATPCLAVGFAMALAREADDARDAGWWGAFAAAVGMFVVATCGDALRFRIWQAIGGMTALVIGLAVLALSGAWWACLFVAFGTGAGVFWSRFPLEKHWRPKRGVVWFFVLLALGAYSLVGFAFEPVAPLELTIWFALLLPVMVLSAALREYARFPLLALAVAAAFVFSYFDMNDIHTVRSRPVLEAARTVPPAATAFDAWLNSRNEWEKGSPHPVFLVAAEGGGMRAAYWTALVLEELRARNARFPEHTFLIAGVSGGSVGAAAYAAALAQGIGAAKPPPDGTEPHGGAASETAVPAPPLASRAKSVEALQADLLSPLLRGLFMELPTRALPTFATTWFDLDRTRRLEGAFEASWQRTTGKRIDNLYVQDLRVASADRNVPNLLLLTTSVDTGHRMAVGHLAMPTTATAASPCRNPGQDEVPETAARLWNLAEETPGIDLPLATAAMLSARFTLLTPAGTLPCGPDMRRRFVDGGYFENSGVTTLLDVVAEVREIAAKRGVRLVVIRIENSRATTNPTSRKGRTPEPPYNGFGELWSPVRAMMGTRQARGELAVVSLGRIADRSRDECRLAKKAAAAVGHPVEPCLPIEQVVFELRPGNVHIPLGWWLSDGARKDMERQLRDSSKSLDCVRDLLAGKECGSEPPA